MRQNGKLSQSECYTTTYGLKSFRYEGAKVWNEACDLLKDFKTISDFKAGLEKWEGAKCSCANCILCMLKEI